MYILLHAKAEHAGPYRFEVHAMIGDRNSQRYGKAIETVCHSARSARSFANGMEQGYHEATGTHVEIISTQAFEAEYDKETAE